MSLIENKQISKTLHEISYTPSIEDIEWLEILEALNENSIFLRIIKNAKNYYEKRNSWDNSSFNDCIY